MDRSWQGRELIRPLGFTVLTVLCALLCRRVVLTTESAFLEQLANYVRVFLYLGLFALWGFAAYQRVIQPQVRRQLVSVAAIMVLWLAVREFRWHLVPDPGLNRFLWYSYYIPILLIPMLAFLVSLSLGRGSAYRLPRYTALLYLPTAALMGLALTNDLHGLLFVFPEEAARAELDYGYGILYWFIVGWGVLCTLGAFITMLRKCRIPRTGRIQGLPLLPFAAALLYIALYASRVPFVTGTLGDMTVSFCLLFTAFFESCIRCGLIQSNARYRELFLACRGISVQIADRDRRIRYAAHDAEPVSPEDMLRAEAGPVLLPEGKQLHVMPIRGGCAAWTEDVSELLALRDSLAETREELQERSGLLQAKYAQEKEYRRVLEQNRLYDLLQNRTQPQLDEVSRLTTAYGAAETEEEKRRILLKILLLGSYIKRRKDLVLQMEGGSSIPEERLKSALEESLRALSMGGIRGAALVETGRETLSGELMARAYDFFEAAAEALLYRAKYIAVHVGVVKGDLRCGVTADREGNTESLRRQFPRLRRVPDEDGGVTYLLSLGGGGEA